MQETSFMHEILTIRFIVPDRQVTSIKEEINYGDFIQRAPLNKQKATNKQTPQNLCFTKD